MTDNAREAMMLAAQYLYGSIDALRDQKKVDAIKKLLIKQKQWVEVYTDARAEHLLAAKSCPVVAALSPDVWLVKRYHKNIEFVGPQEGSFIVIDALVVPAATNNDTLIYQFINYLYRPEVIRHHLKKFGFCPPTVDVSVKDRGIFCPTGKEFNKLDFF